MSVKIYEGKDLDVLIEKAKNELGDIEILYYEVEKAPGILPFFRKKKYRLFVTKKENTEENRVEHLEEEIKELKSLLVDLKENVTKLPSQQIVPSVPEHLEEKVVCAIPQIEEFTGDAVELINILIKKGVEPSIAVDIVRASCGLDIETEKLDLNTGTFKEALINAFKKKLKFTGEFTAEKGKQKIIAFVGPTGVGKTTNLFKIASKFVIDQDLNVGVISTDTFKVGGTQQARIYTSILNIPFFIATDQKKLKEIVENLSELDVILIDTVGRSHYDYFRLGEIKTILGGLNSSIDYVLLISCNYDTKEAMEIVNRYRSFFPISSLFFTKIDESSKPGILINAGIKSGIPLSYVSTGQRVPEDIKLLSPFVISDFLLGA
ncbi:flagellar biosynthesis protein FlhF [Desulfurobacterium sp.]|uniref:flagellar biosynthesis protein FlhF n=1 Tax=Desulfurobacterium sp. TaxID=2004706 RepID=UPI00260A30EB|nr:flagellar biosynthesis protein FlhF [Desulfurobacterium sp.]